MRFVNFLFSFFSWVDCCFTQNGHKWLNMSVYEYIYKYCTYATLSYRVDASRWVFCFSCFEYSCSIYMHECMKDACLHGRFIFTYTKISHKIFIFRLPIMYLVREVCNRCGKKKKHLKFAETLLM